MQVLVCQVASCLCEYSKVGRGFDPAHRNGEGEGNECQVAKCDWERLILVYRLSGAILDRNRWQYLSLPDRHARSYLCSAYTTRAITRWSARPNCMASEGASGTVSAFTAEKL